MDKFHPFLLRVSQNTRLACVSIGRGIVL